MTENRIVPVMVPDSVVGLQQQLYLVDGNTVGLDEAMRQAELDIIGSLEKLIRDTAKVMKLRTERLKELNRAITMLVGVRTYTQALDSGKTYSSQEVDDIYEITSRLQVASVVTGSPTNNVQVTKAYAQINNAIEDERNRLQQAAGPLRNYIGQRDRHFARLDTVMRRVSGMPAGTVRNIG